MMVDDTRRSVENARRNVARLEVDDGSIHDRQV
jgi:hypothetical protein